MLEKGSISQMGFSLLYSASSLVTNGMHTPPKSPFFGFLGVARMNFERILRIWTQTIFPPIITTLLYILVFGYSIGHDISQMHGVPYLSFILPGLMMMSVITSSYMNTAFSFFIARIQQWIEEILVAPVSNAELILGFLVGGVFRGCLVGILIFAVGFFMADISVQNWPLVIALLVLTSTMFALAGFLNALFAKTFDGVNFVPTFILTPLTFLGGVFYSLDRLPEFWQQVTVLNPIFWIISGFREGFYGISEIPIILPLGFLIIMTIILFWACLHFVGKGKNIRS